MIAIEEALQLVDSAIEPERLSSVQELILIRCWSGQTYQEIAHDSGYDPDYIRVVGSRLWQILSQAFGEKITKNNFRSILRQHITKEENRLDGKISALELPNTPVPLDSSLYIERPATETLAYQEVEKSGALIRIKGLKQMGKTSLVMRVLARGRDRGYNTARLNLLQAEDNILSNLERLLRWFCANLSLQLGLESVLDEYWDEDLGVKVSCTTYLQGYILEQLSNPLVIAIDEVDRLFRFPEVASEFLPLLRFWHEEANNLLVWQKLRSIVTLSTEIYVDLDLNQSPFNAGLSIVLKEFDLEQVSELARRYGLEKDVDIQLEQIKSLTSIIGGHPYLVNLTFYHLMAGNDDLEQILREAATDTGIYRDHLRGHLITLEQNPELAAAYKQVIESEQPIILNSLISYGLESIGLVKLEGNKTTPLCELYRFYFRDRL